MTTHPEIHKKLDSTFVKSSFSLPKNPLSHAFRMTAPPKGGAKKYDSLTV